MCFNPQDVSQVIASRQVGSASHNLYNYRTTDGGTTWNGAQLTSFGKKAFRPYIPHGSARLFFVCGDYTTYSSFSTSILSMPVP